MAAGVILEFEGVTQKEYDAVNAALGIDMSTGSGDWPDGLISHSAGHNEAGRLVVMEVWDSPEHQARFMEGRLGEALEKGGVTEPPVSVTWRLSVSCACSLKRPSPTDCSAVTGPEKRVAPSLRRVATTHRCAANRRSPPIWAERL